MKAIIIQDADAKALLDKLELEKFRAGHRGKSAQKPEDEMHHWFYYIVCTWLQEQGAKVT